MNCTACGEKNESDARFCAECGTAITIACAGCGRENPPSAKFCNQCGTPTGGDTGAAVPATNLAVRRTVTILFADLVGSTAFGESVDAEIARQEMGAYHQLARDVVESAGGEVIKFIGDGVMAGFGVHETAEDDADRAVRAGLELQREFIAIVDGIQDRHGAEVGLRVGINTGEVVIDDDDADMVGDPINTAARIEGQCTPGCVLVGEQTWRLTRSTVDYEVLGEVDVKGKSEPIATFQVLAAVEDEEIATPFVGRDAELAALSATLENTIADGAPQLVTVIGSPGVGKTRLAAELARNASEVTSFDLRVDRAGAATFEPIAELLKTVSDLPAGLSDDDTAIHIRAFVGAVEDADRLAPLLAGFVGAAPLRSTEESFWAARRLVEIVVADRPAVIVVDDIQWAEPLFLDLLEHLVEWTDGAAFLVALARPEIREIRPAFAEVGRRVSEVISLEGLDTETMAELATRILGGKALPPELVARLPESTEGNPLFVRELVRMLVDDNVIRETQSGWVLAIDAEAVEVPPTIISLLASRVERMDDDERQVIEAASIVGSEFARGAVGTLLPNLGAAQLDHILERLRRQEIVDPTGNYWGDEPVWRFHHVLIRDAAYRRLLKERRADMHRQVGQWTETTSASLSGEHEISIAFHYEQAHGYLRELGPLSDDALALGGRAADLLAVAAERALARDDLAAAGSLSSRALAILDADDPQRPELLLATCEAWFGAGRVHDGTPALEELRTHTSDPRVRAWTAAFEGQYVVLTEPDRLNEVEPIVAEAAAQLTTLGDDAGVAKARLIRALILARLGRVGECEEELDAALAAARAADDRRRITAVLGAAPVAALWGPSPVARAGGRCLDIIRLLRITSASPMVEAVSIRCQAVLEAMRGRFDEARGLLAKSLAIVEELGLRHGILECRMFAGYIELLADDPAAAEPHLRVAYAGLGTLGVGADAGQAAALLSRALLRLGRVDEAAELADSSAELAGQNLQTSIASRAAQAEIAARQGRRADAKALAEAAAAMGANTDLTMDHANALLSLAEVYRLGGDETQAEAARSRAEGLFATKGATVIAPTNNDPAVRYDFVSDSMNTPATAYARAASEALYDRRDIDAWQALCRPDATFIDRRSLHDDSTDLAGRTELQRQLLSSLDSYESELIAARGQRLCVFRNRLRGDENRAEFSMLNLIEVDDAGLLATTVLFDADDFVGAISELTERYRAGEGAPFAHVLDAGRQYALAMIAGRDEFLESVTEDFVLLDNRTLGMEPVSGADFYDQHLTRERNDKDLAATFGRSIERITEHGTVGFTRAQSYGDSTIEADWSWVTVQVVRDGKTARMEFFDEADLDKALQQFDRLTNSKSGVENAASRLVDRFWSCLYGDLDVDRAGAYLVADYTINDHRQIGTGASDRDSVLSFMRESIVGVSTVDWENRTVAVRGENLVLSQLRATFTPINFSREFMQLERSTGDLIRSAALYDPEDLDAAYRELERQFREHEGAEFADVLDLVTEGNRILATLDVDATWDVASPTCVVVDHRPIQQHETLLADMIDAQVATGMRGRITVEQFPRLTSQGVVLVDHSQFRDSDGIPVEFRTCQVRIFRNGKQERLEIFPEHDVDAACARFDELTSRSGPRNAASDAAGRFYVELTNSQREGVDPILAMLSDDWEMTDERTLGTSYLDRASAPGWFAQQSDSGATDVDTDVVAIRGGRLALVDVRAQNDAGAWHYLGLAEIDEHERHRRTALFNGDDLRPALDRLNEWFVDGSEAPPRETLELSWSLGRAQETEASGQGAALAELLHADVEMHDHRRFSIPTIGLNDVTAAGSPIIEEYAVVVPEYLAINDRGIVIVQENRGRNETGGATVRRQLTLVVHRDGKARNVEWFEEDDVDAALARFTELTAERSATTAAERFTARYWPKLYDELDPEGTADFLTPDYTMTDVRQFGAEPLDRESTIEFMRASLEGVESVDWDTEVLAARGDLHDITRLRGRYLPADFTREALLLQRLRGEQSVQAVIFDPGEFDAAYEELERQYREHEGAEFADVLDAITAQTKVLAAGDTEAGWELTHDDCIVVDHRPLLQINQPLRETADAHATMGYHGRAVVERYLRLTNDGAVFFEFDDFEDANGTPVEFHSCQVRIMRDGKLIRWEIFPSDEADAACARFDELTAVHASTGLGPLGNQASDLVQAVYSLLEEKDFDAMMELVADELVAEDRRPMVAIGAIGKADLAANYAVFLEAEDGVSAEIGVIATAGERLVVCSIATKVNGSDFVSPYLAVVETDGALLTNLLAFEPHDVVAATEEMHRRFAVGEGAEYASTLDQAQRVLSQFGDLDQFAALITDDFAAVDHRSIGLGTVSRDEFLGFLAGGVEVAGQRELYTRRYLRLDHGVTLTETWIENADMSWPMLMLGVDRGNKMAHLELFDVDDIDAAVARFEELTRPNVVVGTSGLELLVERTGLAGFDAVDRADWTALRESYVPDATFAPRHGRTGPGPEVQNRDEFVATAESFSKEGLVVSAREFLATRGDRLGIARVTMERDGFVVVMDNLVDVDADGQILRSAMFDESDPDIARAELENWWIESLDADQARTLAVIREYDRSIIDASGIVDSAAMRAALPEDATFNDYRPLSFGQGIDRERFINVFAIDAVGAPVTIADAFTTHWPRLTSAGSVRRIIAHYADGTEFDNAVVTFIENGRITGSDWFAGDDLPAAVAHFDERTDAPRRGNRASEVDLEFRAAVGRRDAERLAEIVSPDAAFVDHRTLVSRPVDTIEGLVDSVHAYADQAMTHTFQLLSWRSETLALVKGTFAAESGFDVHLYTVTEIDEQGQVCRFETFADENLLAAQRRMDELWWDSDGAYARAWGRPLHDLGDAMTAGDWDSVRAVLAPDFQHIVTKQISSEGAADADRFVENMGVWTDLSGSSRSEAGELYKSTADGCVMHLDVYATDATGMVTQWASANVFVFVDGRLTYWEEFEEDDVDAAIARFDEVTKAAELDSSALAVQTRDFYRLVFDEKNVDRAFEEYVADDLVVADHRGAGVMNVDRAMTISVYRDFAESPTLNWRYEMIAVSGEVLGLHRVHSSDGSGFEWIYLQIDEFDTNRKVRRAELFDPEDLDAARARFDQRSAELQSDSTELQNQATVKLQAFYEAVYTDRDLARGSAMVRDDFVGEDRRALVGSTIGASDFAANFSELLDHDGVLEWSLTTIAIAGERLCLSRFNSGRAGFEIELLIVGEIDDAGLGRAVVTFDVDHLDDATAEMNRRFVEGEGAPYRDILELGWTMRDSINDPDAIASLLSDDFVFADHRTLGLGQLDAGAYVAVLRAGLEENGSREARILQFVRFHRNATMSEFAITGAGTEWRMLTIGVRDGDRVCRHEYWDLEDLDAALERFDELTADPEPRNLVHQLLGQGAVSMESGGFDPRQHLGDATIVDHRTGVIPIASLDSLVESIAAFDEQEMDFTSEVVAWRGEFAGLQRLTRSTASGMRYVMYNVIQVDENARPTRFETFGEDQLDEALRRLDDLWWENDGQEFRRRLH